MIGKIKKPLDKCEAIKILCEVKMCLDELNVEYWLDQGTSLGAVRDKDFIVGDNDIDLGMMYTQYEKIVRNIEIFQKRDFFIRISDFTVCIRKNEIPINIVLYRIKGNEAWWCNQYNQIRYSYYLMAIINTLSHGLLYKNEGSYEKMIYALLQMAPKVLKIFIQRVLYFIWECSGGKHLIIMTPKKYFEHLDTIIFHNKEYKVPSPIEQYLRYKYGKSWRQVNKNWDFRKDDGSIRGLTIFKMNSFGNINYTSKIIKDAVRLLL